MNEFNNKKKFESVRDIVAWQKAKELAVHVYRLTDNTTFEKDFNLKNQVRKSAISVVSNIAEGYGRQGNKEFLQFLYISNGSLTELETQLMIASELNYLSQKEYEVVAEMMHHSFELINGMIHYLKNTDIKGYKFKEPEITYGFSVDQLLQDND